jgi:hypothetical protein
MTGEGFSIKLSPSCVLRVGGGMEDHQTGSQALGLAAQQQYQRGQLLASFVKSMPISRWGYP